MNASSLPAVPDRRTFTHRPVCENCAVRSVRHVDAYLLFYVDPSTPAAAGQGGSAVDGMRSWSARPFGKKLPKGACPAGVVLDGVLHGDSSTPLPPTAVLRAVRPRRVDGRDVYPVVLDAAGAAAGPSA